MQSKEPGTSEPKAPSRPARIALTSLIAGLIAGLLATAGAELMYLGARPDPQYPANFSTLSGSEKTAVRARVRFQSRVLDERNKAMAAFGLLGSVLAAAMARTGGRCGHYRRTRLNIGIAVILLAGLAGAGLSMVLVPVFFESSDAQTGLPLLFVTHLAIFGAVGMAAGLAFGWAWGSRRAIIRCMIGGLVGAFIGTFAFEVINFVSFPNLRMYEPVPLKTLPRMILNLWVAGAIGLFIGLAARKLPARQAEESLIFGTDIPV